jgi:dihydroorotate dehydrogenase
MDPYAALVRPHFFRMDAEAAHDAVLAHLSGWRTGGGLAEALLAVSDDRLTVRLGPLVFRNPVGLAAGLDKHGTAAHVWPWLGFGACEIGTITPRPQPGNPRPRLFRLTADAALINRFGFNSPGVEAVARTLEGMDEGRRSDVPRGLNVGKNKDTPPEAAAEDHRFCIERLRPFADYFVVNVSSPNTPGLRTLQQPAFIRALVADAVAAAGDCPVFVKIAPDWSPETALDETVAAIVEGGAFGLVATNTTLAREGLSAPSDEAGGLSGRPLRTRALEVMQRIRRCVGPALPLIGVGGIESGDDAYERLAAGADLVQIYTAFVYGGPTTPRRLCRRLVERLVEDGVEDVAALRARRLRGGGEPAVAVVPGSGTA